MASSAGGGFAGMLLAAPCAAGRARGPAASGRGAAGSRLLLLSVTAPRLARPPAAWRHSAPGHRLLRSCAARAPAGGRGPLVPAARLPAVFPWLLRRQLPTAWPPCRFAASAVPRRGRRLWHRLCRRYMAFRPYSQRALSEWSSSRRLRTRC